MEKSILEELINKGYSTYEIAKETNYSQTNVRHWLRKHGLNTKHKPFKYQEKSKSNTPNGLFCVNCQKELLGYNTTYCNNKCKCAYYYKNNKEVAKASSNRYQRSKSKERKLLLIEMSGGGCEICGYNKNYAALVFHHKDPKNKTFTLDSRKLSNTNWESILLEFEKCQCLCANCHAEVHNPDKTTIKNPPGEFPQEG
jgi:predicted transcriptional regulator